MISYLKIEFPDIEGIFFLSRHLVLLNLLILALQEHQFLYEVSFILLSSLSFVVFKQLLGDKNMRWDLRDGTDQLGHLGALEESVTYILLLILTSHLRWCLVLVIICLHFRPFENDYLVCEPPSVNLCICLLFTNVQFPYLSLSMLIHFKCQ